MINTDSDNDKTEFLRTWYFFQCYRFAVNIVHHIKLIYATTDNTLKIRKRWNDVTWLIKPEETCHMQFDLKYNYQNIGMWPWNQLPKYLPITPWAHLVTQ